MMKIRSRAQVAAGLALALAVAGLTLSAAGSKKKDKTSTTGSMPESKRALHALQRLTFGPRPGESERVAAMGVDKWIEQQLQPDKIDDSALAARLESFRTLRMDTKEIVENFPPQQVIKAVMEGKRPMPSDPAKRAVYEAQIEKLHEKQERKQEAAAIPVSQPASAATNEPASGDATANSGDAANNAPPASTPPDPKEEMQARRREDRLYADLKAQELLDLPPEERMKQVLQMSPEEQRESEAARDAEGPEQSGAGCARRTDASEAAARRLQRTPA
jgi:hypothetical protein